MLRSLGANTLRLIADAVSSTHGEAGTTGTQLSFVGLALVAHPKTFGDGISQSMDSANDPKSQLVKQLASSGGGNASSLYSQFTENPFFTAVRSISVLAS
jgi:hypothetical protein